VRSYAASTPVQESRQAITGWAARRGPAPGAGAGLFRAASLRTQAVGELVRAEDLGREVQERCQKASSPSDIEYAALVNLASVLRVTGRLHGAGEHDQKALNKLIMTYGELHPFTLAAGINYVADLAACDELAEAIRIGQATLDNCHQSSLGENWPGREGTRPPSPVKPASSDLLVSSMRSRSSAWIRSSAPRRAA
jgi:hypothetical protein